MDLPFRHGTRGRVMWYAIRILPLLTLILLIDGLANHLAHQQAFGISPLAALRAHSITVQQSTTLLSTDGTQATVRVTGKTYQSTATRGRERYYIGNKKTKVFHRPSCSYLPAKKNRVYFQTRTKAIRAGYRPCKKCKP